MHRLINLEGAVDIDASMGQSENRDIPVESRQDTIAPISLLSAAMAGVEPDVTALALSQIGYLAGSSVAALFIKGMPFEDYDLYFSSARHFAAAFNTLQSLSDADRDTHPLAGYKCIDTIGDDIESSLSGLHTVNFSSKNKKSIQLIKTYWHENPEDLLSLFDFTISQFCLTDTTFWVNPVGLIDGYNKRISLTDAMHLPVNTMNRVLKYAKKGFSAPAATLLGISNNLAGIGSASSVSILGSSDPDYAIKVKI